MFKEIVASFLLSTLISTPIIQSRNDSVYSTALEGSYCLRTDIDTSLVVNDLDLDVTSGDFERTNLNWSVGIYTSGTGLYSMWENCDINYEVSYDDWYFSLYFNNGDNTRDLELDIGTTYSNYPEWYQRFMIYFDSPYIVSQEFYQLWQKCFTKQGNTYCSVYTGWYTFNNVPNFTGVDMYCYIYGNIIVNNNLYNSLYFGTGLGNHIDAAYDNSVTNLHSYYNLYIGGTWADDYKVKTAYFTGVMIPSIYKVYLSQIGTFDFVVVPVQYDFGNMIFSVIDAPIYMLTQLFNFELFGIQLYVAFMGVVTLLLIMFLVRKMI